MSVYRSKLDLWLSAFVGLGVFLPVLFAVMTGEALLLTLSICGPLALFIIWLYFATLYKVSAEQLTIHAGFYKVPISIASIQSVKKSRNPLSSPAFSLDRLEITYGKNKSILISPKNETQFLQDIGWSLSSGTHK